MTTRSAALSIIGLAAGLAGCVTHPGGKPYLTNKAFARAAAACHVISQGVHHVLGSEIPHGNYKLASGIAQADDDDSQACMAKALTGYRYDYLGEEMTPTRP
jgi:hypothetical protein